MKSCVLGATGAIGQPIADFLFGRGEVLKLNSRNCNLNSETGISDFSFGGCDVFVNASGTFGGLKSYESGAVCVSEIYYRNLCSLIDQLKPEIIINISSASVSNPDNHKEDSAYFEYVQIKQNIETLVSNKSARTVLNLRCTNIISQYEDFQRSGHSIASIYKRYLTANSDRLEIWSNELDWREYIDADDLVSLFPEILAKSGKHTLTIGSGQKTYMRDIIFLFNKYMRFEGDVIFTQPKKNGPQQDVVSIPSSLVSGNDIKLTAIENSIKKCIERWDRCTNNLVK